MSSDQYAGNLGITDAVDTDPVSVLPLGEAAKNISGIVDGEWADVSAGVADLAANAVGFAADPLNWLISAGLTFLIDFVQPLEDALSLVTGNAERMEPYAAQWQEIGQAMIPLADAIRQAATEGLAEWHGQDADAARQRLAELSDAVRATGGEAMSISGLLTLFSKLMAAAQQVIIGIIATLIEWMIVEWAAAMAAAVPTAGGSVAAAGAATGVQATVATSRAVRIIDRVVELLTKIGKMINKVLPPALRGQVGDSVLQFTSRNGTRVAADLSTLGRVTLNNVADWKSYAGPAVNVGVGTYKAATSGGSDMSAEDIDDALGRR